MITKKLIGKAGTIKGYVIKKIKKERQREIHLPYIATDITIIAYLGRRIKWIK